MKQQLESGIGYTMIFVGATILILAPIVIPWIIQFAEQNISSDGILYVATKTALGAVYLLIVIVFGLLGSDLLGLMDLKENIKKYRLFLLSSSVGIVWITLYNLRNVLHINHLYFTEDSIFENITAINFFISSLVLVFILYQLGKSEAKRKIYIITIIALLSLFFFLLGGEEISWGQRVFGWGTPEIFSGNVQHETNFHNLIPWRHLVSYYQVFNVLLGIVFLFSCWISFRQKHTYLTWLVLPPCDLVILVLLILPTAHEIWEELVSILSLFYSLRIFFLVYRKRDRVIKIA